MSTLENTATPELNRIPLGRRITELLKEKGEAYSIRSFAAQLGVNRESLRQMLNGSRTILPSELQQIAKGLGVSVERLKQMDCVKKEQELATILQAKTRTKVMMTNALSLANEVAKVAQGSTERGYSLNNLGRVQYLLRNYEEAHESWQKALQFAKEIHTEYEDSNLLYLVTANLMLTHTVRKEYSNIEEMLQVVETAFAENPRAMGLTHYTRMKMHEARGNFDRARKHAYLSLENYEQTYDSLQVGIAMINVAHFESLLQNFLEAAKILADAVQILQPYEYSLVFAVNEQVKVLLKLGELETAKSLIFAHVENSKSYPDLHNKLLIYRTIAERTPVFAERVQQDTDASLEIRLLACKCLIEYYSSIDDAESVLRYYKMGRMLSGKNSEFFDWEAKV
ncbi:helix-turn-helix domain-containing protein [Tumebacillus flagellatus]|uniref:HTH cro/C1-type domain-containing protein n=1 Tax=Tumebacillus flagellatus TaxID=1157490 RepID=A0A074LFT1_9BACL|nr:helix-turn-helix transcriptional regulator [Tumebacillus flagellatus]KEO81091.1 hypothetical protein EL26_22605 [Tumebacillus flagellatus]